MNGRHVPIEGDCDVCGKNLETAEIARNYSRLIGTMTCDQCVKIHIPKHNTFED